MTRPLTEWDTEPITRDPDEEYRVLERSLRWVKGFSLYFVVCTPVEGERIITKIKAGLPQKKVEVLRLTEEIDNLYQILETIPDKDTLNILFIKGLEYSLNAYVKPGIGGQGDYYNLDSLPPLLGHLNLQRERFRDNFNFCLVFLLPKFAHKFLIRRAPDFYDWSSGYFEFPMNAEVLKTETQPYQIERDFEEYENLTPEERHQKILEIESLLDEPELTPDDKANLLVEQGLLFLASKNYEHSIRSFQKAITIKSDNYNAWYYQGNTFWNLEQIESALNCYNQSLLINPKSSLAWQNRGNALWRLNRFDEAIASYNQALVFSPADHAALNNRGILLAKQRRYEEAIASFDQALTIKLDKDEAWYNRGLTLWAQGQVGEAIFSYDRAIAINPDDCATWNNRGVALAKLGRLEEAIASFNQAIALAPDEQLYRVNKEYILTQVQTAQDQKQTAE